MGKFALTAIVYSGSSPRFCVFTIDYGDSIEDVDPKLTIFATFPWKALCSLFMELMLSVKLHNKLQWSCFSTVAFPDEPPSSSSKSHISAVFPMNDDDFWIDLLRECAKVNDYRSYSHPH